MKVIKCVDEMHEYRAAIAGETKVGFVPTLGGLHAGHIALMRRCAAEQDVTIVSIYLNSAQFAAGEDLDKYPANMEEDLKVCERLGVDAVFTPAQGDVYPPTHEIWVHTAVGEPTRNARSEGASRPTFFRGVATVLCKLLTLVRPDALYAGQKDAQQCAVMRTLRRELWPLMELVLVPIEREADGLAISTRNRYLSEAERRYAPVLHRALCTAEDAFQRGERNAQKLRDAAVAVLEGTQAPHNVRFELLYVSVCDEQTMVEEEGNVGEKGTLMCVAAKMGDSRLIDNIRLE